MSVRFSTVGVQVAVPQAAGGDAAKVLLRDINLDLTERRVSVIGANGSGKSTLLRLINGLVTPSVGAVTVDGLDVASRIREVRAAVGFVFTDPLSQLVMPTPAEDVELSLRRSVPDRTTRRARALDLLAERGLGDVADQSIYDLSGGERQLVALASVLAVEPTILVLDEPTTLLDLRNREALRRVLRHLPQQVIFATHDLEFATDADRTVVIDGGTVAFDGAPTEAVARYRQLVTP